jgi:hypothetical protein
MLAPLTRDNVVVFDPSPLAGLPRQIRALSRPIKRYWLQVTVGAVVVAWWLQVFFIWVGVLQDVSLLGGPLAG